MVARNCKETWRRERDVMMRTHEEELANFHTRMAIVYDNDSEQIVKVRSKLDQIKSTIAKKDEQIKNYSRNRMTS